MKRSGIRPVSRKRAAQKPLRDACVNIVLRRDVRCRGAGLTPVNCSGAATEVHELGRGAYRQSCWLIPEMCLGLCSICHRWVTLNPDLAEELGLALRGYQVEKMLTALAAVDIEHSDPR